MSTEFVNKPVDKAHPERIGDALHRQWRRINQRRRPSGAVMAETGGTTLRRSGCIGATMVLRHGLTTATVFALLLVSACARHQIIQVDGVASERANNPAVTVTSDVEMIRREPSGMEPAMDYQLSPGLATSFERALERHVQAAEVRIFEAVIAPKTMLNQQYVRTSMLVEANGRTYRLRHDWETDKAGFWGTRYQKRIPVFLDALAEKLAGRLTATQAS